MAARELRYAYVDQLRLAIGADGIVVAHHSDDNVETILLNLVRGTGIYGLEGIKPRNGFILRPLLCLSKNEILDYLSSVNQDFITDSSNLVDDVQRNKIRLNLMPILRSVNPSASENILTTAENISQAARVYSHAINESVNECFDGKALDITKLLQQPSPEAVLYEVLKTFDFSSGTVRQIFDNLSAPSGKTWSNDTYTVAMDRGTLFIGKSYSETPPLVIPEEGLYRIAGDVSNIKVEVAPLTAETIISKEPFIATLDADKVAFPLTLRLVQTGDRFVPFGMKGSKLISDYLTDKKKNYFQRKAQLVVADATDKIVWLIGERVSAEASVGPDTIKVLTLRYSKE
jgi:tRNA(Ile)-lysidine synthase